MIHPYPLQLAPLVKEVVWGGRWLATELGRPGAADARLGESWEAWAGSVVQNGAWAGRTLGDLFLEQGIALAGAASSRYSRFPLLVKFIDAHQNLSLQVHPDDTLAQQLENYPFGKTEFWYVLAAQPGAHIYYGLNAENITQAMLARALETQTLLTHVHRAPVQTGDVVFIPAGTVHALTEGVVVYELQQDSDITYRLYDWGRTDREIHLEKGLKAIRCGYHSMQIARPQAARVRDGARTALAECEYFQSELWSIERTAMFASHADSFTLLTALDGAGTLTSPQNAFEPLQFARGNTLFLPAGVSCVLSNQQVAETVAPLTLIRSALN